MKKSEFSVWLYGSHARGITDDCSDMDVLVIGDAILKMDEIQNSIPISINSASVSRYTWNEISEMAEYGSLFLHHIKLEAYPLYESNSCRGNLSTLLSNLKSYKRTKHDLKAFLTVLDDVSDALRNNETEIFELSVLGTVIRHCSILGCWHLGQPCFSRIDPVNILVNERNLDQNIKNEFEKLYQYRLYIDRRVDKASLTHISSLCWLERARDIVKEVEVLAA